MRKLKVGFPWCMELQEWYRLEWMARRALEAAVPTAWMVLGKAAFAAVKFPREAEPGERWADRAWVAYPWVFGNGIFGVEVSFGGEGRFTAVACPQHADMLIGVEGLHVLLNTEPVVGLMLHREAVDWLRGWALALTDNGAVRKKAVERARRLAPPGVNGFFLPLTPPFPLCLPARPSCRPT